MRQQKVVVVGAGPVGALAALYAAQRGDDVHVYELRAGMLEQDSSHFPSKVPPRSYVFTFLLYLCEDLVPNALIKAAIRASGPP